MRPDESCRHPDGRECRYSKMTGSWYHWEHPGPEPGPREVVRYQCARYHNDPADGDRGDFGMPTLGTLMRPLLSGGKPNEVKQERVCDIMDEAQTLYRRKAAGYVTVEGDLSDFLGVKAQFVDINRKFWRLKSMLWDEVVPMYPDAGAGESVEEILMDFIGHAALTIDFLRQSRVAKEESK